MTSESHSSLWRASENPTETARASLLGSLSTRWRVWRIKRRVWVTTRGKDGFVLVSRWRLLAAAFSRKDVRLDW